MLNIDSKNVKNSYYLNLIYEYHQAIEKIRLFEKKYGKSWKELSTSLEYKDVFYGLTNIDEFFAELGPDRSKEMETKRSIISSIIYVVITWSIAQFGLLPLIAKGYGTLGYVAIFVIIIPLLVKGIKGWK